MKKLPHLFHSFCMMFCVLSVFTVSARAATKLNTISDFSQTLSWSQYNVLRRGNYSAECIDGVWYYKFTFGDKYVYVKWSAFANTASNSYDDLNANLNKGVESTNSATNPSYVYKTSSGYSPDGNYCPAPYSLSYSDPLKKNTYTTYLTYLKMYSSISGNTVTLQCNMCGHALFTLREDPTAGLTLKQRYEAALKRETGQVSRSITPKFEFTVDKVGSKHIVLKEFCYKTQGIVTKEHNVGELIDVGFTVGSITSAVMTAGESVAIETLYSLLGQTINLTSNSSRQWDLSKFYPLSVDGKSVLKSKFTSPVDLKDNEDYFEVQLNLNEGISFAEVPAKLSVAFSA